MREQIVKKRNRIYLLDSSRRQFQGVFRIFSSVTDWTAKHKIIVQFEVINQN